MRCLIRLQNAHVHNSSAVPKLKKVELIINNKKIDRILENYTELFDELKHSVLIKGETYFINDEDLQKILKHSLIK